MRAPNGNARRQSGVDDAQANTHNANISAPSRASQAKQLATIQAAPDDGKTFAMFLFNIGASDLEGTQVKFGRHPEWRHA